MKLYRNEDFKGLEIQDSWTSFDVLAAVASQIRKNEFPKNVQDSCFTLKNKKLVKKKEVLVYVKEHKIKKKKSQKRSSSSNVEPTICPEEFKNAINEELNGGKDFNGEVKLLAEKTLYAADILESQNRLSLPLSYMKCDDFLKTNEKIKLETRIEKNKHGFMEVKIIEPSLERGVVKLRIWENNYVLNGTWKEIVKRNQLGVGTKVQLWGFRIDEELCLALRKLPNSEMSLSVE